MPNNTACSTTGTCLILGGALTNGTEFVAQYNPNAPVPYWHQRMELATIIVCNSLTFILIVTRLWYRWKRLNRFGGDDKWMAVAGFFLIGYTASQMGTNHYGSGLHMDNIPKPWRSMHWHWLVGWAGYYIVTTCIKISVCFSFLEILSHLRTGLTYAVYGLLVLIGCLGLTMTGSWLASCSPFLSNFVWAIESTYCINYDIFRWLWIGLSIPIDCVLLFIPLRILKRARLREQERRILKMVFCATLLGTITCAVGIFGAYETRTIHGNDGYYKETAFVMMNDIEILMYALGSTFPVFSRYLILRINSVPDEGVHNNFSSFARHIPDFFMNDGRASSTVHETRARQSEHIDREAIVGRQPESLESDDSNSNQDMDTEKGYGDYLKEANSIPASARTSQTTNESILKEYIRQSKVVGGG